jgi:hypothetical protein
MRRESFFYAFFDFGPFWGQGWFCVGIASLVSGWAKPLLGTLAQSITGRLQKVTPVTTQFGIVSVGFSAWRKTLQESTQNHPNERG